MTDLVDIRGLRYAYPGAAQPALDGFDLRVSEGEFVCLVGANGSGKSTLARILAGLLAAQEAEKATVCDEDLRRSPGRHAVRRHVGILFQDPDNQIVGASVEEDVAFGLENLAIPTPEIRARVDSVLKEFGLDGLAQREPHLLSGGQKQRLALAGVLAIPRRLLVLDEPTAMLDPEGRDEVLGAVRAAHRAGMTVLLITQEMDELTEGERVIALSGGRCRFDGPASRLCEQVELVWELGLGLPRAAELALAARGRGRHIDRLPLTLEDLVILLSDPR